ncbi:uncharacterized protein LOC123685730 [Harmonia axyridis]|uniref:uncharacterized protein LOC123685730 n=1 Tax=Harmonia axyridis TaxID=115357 RepID=UPI001E27958D|nr:uncharacterized protein LOC123685730 [Harmonia axyridis]
MNPEGAIKPHIPFLNECSQEIRNVFLKIGLSVMQSSQDRTKVLDKISHELNIEKHKLVELIAIYVEIIKLFLITSDKDFNAQLGQFGFNSEFIEELPLVPNRKEVHSTILKYYKMEKRNLVDLKWTIDLSLYNEFANKNVKYVIIQISTNNGKKTTLKVDIKSFHKLRYNISLILKEMTRLKGMLT